METSRKERREGAAMCSILKTREQVVDPANRGRGLFVDIACASEMMGVSECGVRKMCREGRIKGVRCGKFWRISRDYLMCFLGLEEA